MGVKKIKLKRPISNITGDGEINEVTIKDEKDVSASDFYDMEMSADGKTNLGSMSGVVANLLGLTESQVAEMKPSDYIKIMGEISSFLE